MKVILSEKFGFCFGVQRAVQSVLEETKKKKKIYTFGPIIHNSQFVKKLEEKGVMVLDNIDKV